MSFPHPVGLLPGPIVMALGWSLPFPLDPWVPAGVLGLVGLLLPLAWAGHGGRAHETVARFRGFTWHRATFCHAPEASPVAGSCVVPCRATVADVRSGTRRPSVRRGCPHRRQQAPDLAPVARAP